MFGKWRQQKSKTVPESILEMFLLQFSIFIFWLCWTTCSAQSCSLVFITSKYLPKAVESTAQSRYLLFITSKYLPKEFTCKKETMKEAKTIAQARKPPSCGSPNSITLLDSVLGRGNKEINSFQLSAHFVLVAFPHQFPLFPPYCNLLLIKLPCQ